MKELEDVYCEESLPHCRECKLPLGPMSLCPNRVTANSEEAQRMLYCMCCGYCFKNMPEDAVQAADALE